MNENSVDTVREYRNKLRQLEDDWNEKIGAKGNAKKEKEVDQSAETIQGFKSISDYLQYDMEDKPAQNTIRKDLPSFRNLKPVRL